MSNCTRQQDRSEVSANATLQLTCARNAMSATHDDPQTACDTGRLALSTILPMSPLWPPCATSPFAPPTTSEAAAAIKTWLYSLADGQAFACRGRDYELSSMLDALRGEVAGALEAPLSPNFTGWEYGVGIKMKRAIFLLWEAKVEKHDIGSLDLISLLHICGQTPSNLPISPPPPRCMLAQADRRHPLPWLLS